MDRYWRTDSALALSLALSILLALGAATVARAKEQQDYYRGSHFAPQLTVTPSTTQAGAHPDVAIHFSKTPNHCPGQTYAPFEIVACGENDVYLEQDLKDMTVHLPPGLLADVNGASQCDLRGWAKTGLFGVNNGIDEDWIACAPDTQVGVVDIGFPYFCRWKYRPTPPGTSLYGCGNYDGQNKLGLGIGIGAAGLIFNGVPEPGEQAHLYALIGLCFLTTKYPEPCDPRSGMSADGLNYLVQLVDIGVRIRTESDWGIDTTTTDMPDALCVDGPCPPTGFFPYPVDDFTFSLFGQTGADRKNPFMVSPTSCQPRDASADFRGNSQNVWDGNPDFGFGWWTPGSGDGMTAASASPYPIEGCDSLPYSPHLQLSVDPAAPGAPAAIATTVTQQVGEQTTRRVEVRFPSSFKVNFQNRLAQCSADQAAARTCPGASQVGTVEVQSNLLPETGDSAGPLRGEVFVGETTATDIKLYIVLHGWIEATLRGSIAMNADGSSKATFDLPEVPVQTIALTLFGGADKALMTTPKTCGKKTINAAFMSHQGKVVTQQIPVTIACKPATLDVQLSNRRPGGHPTVTLTAAAAGMRSVSFVLPRNLKRKALAHLRRKRAYGTVEVAGESGARTTSRLVVLGVKGKRARRLATTGRGKGLATGLSSGRHRAGRLSVGRLPEGTTSVTLRLLGKRDGMLQNPRRCRRQLGFLAQVVDAGGNAYRPAHAVRLRCHVRQRKHHR